MAAELQQNEGQERKLRSKGGGGAAQQASRSGTVQGHGGTVRMVPPGQRGKWGLLSKHPGQELCKVTGVRCGESAKI